MKVSIIGVTGYSGLELVRLISTHPLVELVSIHSQSVIDHQLADLFPYLKTICDLKVEAIDPEKIMAQADLVFLATPSGVSGEIAQPFIQANFPVIDLSGDFRLKEQGSYEKWYPGHQLAAGIEKATYGLAEFKENYTSQLIANPGCYATGALLSLAPLVKEDLIELETIIIDGKSGLSGAGKKLSESTHFVIAQENMQVYKVNQHQHIPEIVQQLQAWNEKVKQIQFTTSLIPVKRGIMLTIYLRPREQFASELTTESLVAFYKEFYAEKPFVRVQDVGSFPDLTQVIGSNYCDLGLAYNKTTNLITIVTTLDNLVKGAAGQALQNLNLIYDFPETAGLISCPLYP